MSEDQMSHLMDLSTSPPGSDSTIMMEPPTASTRNPLLLPELFDVVLDHLSKYRHASLGDRHYDQRLVKKEERGALLALAQTCRDFSNPSLDRLWRKLGSLSPLIKCYGGDTNDLWDKKTLTPPTSSELDIIRRYSPRIRTLHLRDAPSLLLVRCIGLKSSSFFPNLTSLAHIDIFPSEDGIPTVPIGTLACLLSPKVTSLELVFTGNVNGVEIFLRDLHQICPNLISFTSEHNKSTSEHQGPQTVHYIRDLSGFKNLQNVTLNTSVDHITFENLSISPSPREFSALVHRKQSTSLKTSLGPTDVPFSHAKHVVLRVWDLDFVTNLLRPSHQAFDYIDVWVDGDEDKPTYDSVYAFFNALASRQLANSLQTIRLRRPQRGQTTAGPPSPALPSLITSFRRLEVLAIDLGNFSIDDDHLADLACLRDSLQVLELTCREASWSLAKHPTLQGVLSLAGSCQRLRELTLSIDARDIPQDTDPNVQNTTLKDVTFLFSPINDPGGVAEFISKHFPSVTCVARTWEVLASPWQEYW